MEERQHFLLVISGANNADGDALIGHRDLIFRSHLVGTGPSVSNGKYRWQEAKSRPMFGVVPGQPGQARRRSRVPAALQGCGAIRGNIGKTGAGGRVDSWDFLQSGTPTDSGTFLVSARETLKSARIRRRSGQPSLRSVSVRQTESKPEEIRLRPRNAVNPLPRLALAKCFYANAPTPPSVEAFRTQVSQRLFAPAADVATTS